MECDVAPRHLTIVECRPPWRQDMGTEWTRFPIARLRYTKSTKQWSLYWRDRHLRFHLYDRIMSAAGEYWIWFSPTSRDGIDAGRAGGCVITPAPAPLAVTATRAGRPARTRTGATTRAPHLGQAPAPAVLSRFSCYGHHRPGGASASVTVRTLNANGCDQRTMRVRLMRVTRVRCRAGLARSPGPGRQEAAPPASVAGSRLDGGGPDTLRPVAGVSASRRTVAPQAGTGMTGAFGTRACRAVAGRVGAAAAPAERASQPAAAARCAGRCSVVLMLRQQRTSRLRCAGRTRWR